MRASFSIILTLCWLQIALGLCSSQAHAAADAVSQLKNRENFTVITGIKFVGNHGLPAKKLKKASMLTTRTFFRIGQVDQLSLRYASSRIISFYRDHGFFFARITDIQIEYGPRQSYAVVTFIVSEGQQTRIDSFTIQGYQRYDSSTIYALTSSRSGKLLSYQQLSLDLDSLLQHYQNAGYFLADIELDVQLKDNKILADVAIVVRENQLVRVSQISYQGVERVDQSLIKNGLQFAIGDPVKTDNINASRRNLYGLGLFESVDIETHVTPNNPKWANIEVIVVEKKPYYVAYGLGYGYESDDLSENISNYSGGRLRLELGCDNLWGRGEQLRFKSLFKLKERKYNLEFVNPKVFGSKLDLDLNGQYQELDKDMYDLERTGAEFLLARKIGPKVTLIGGISDEIIRLSAIDNTQVTAAEIARHDQARNARSGILEVVRDDTNAYFYPTEGLRFRFRYQHTGGQVFQGEDHFFRIDSGFRLYLPILGYQRRTVLAIRGDIGDISPFESSERLPIYALLYGDELQMIRGYSGTELGPETATGEHGGGRAYQFASVELRFPLSTDFYGAIFCEEGEIYRNFAAITKDFARFSYGVGLRYHTVIGPLRIDYAKKGAPRTDESNYVITFSIGEAF